MYAIACASPIARLLIWSCLAILVSPATAEVPASDDTQTADEIISRMNSVYANSHSYQDSGMVKDVFLKTNETRIAEKPFTTAFIRPDRFRYEFRETPPGRKERRFVIHQDGKTLRVHWDLPRDANAPTLDRAIAMATGISSESAITVPGMLLPKEITWRRAIRFSKPTRIQDERVGNRDCFRIHDQFRYNVVTYWIDKENFLLRKIFKEATFDDFRVESTTTYAPVMNGFVEPSLLTFDQTGK